MSKVFDNPKIDNNNLLTVEELLKLKNECLNRLEEEKLYWLRNDAKMRAVYSSESYDEFKDIVDAAHLKAVNKKDKMDATTKSRLWNKVVKED